MMSDVHLSGKAKMNPAYIQSHLPEILHIDEPKRLSWSKRLALVVLWILHKIKKV